MSLLSISGKLILIKSMRGKANRPLEKSFFIVSPSPLEILQGWVYMDCQGGDEFLSRKKLNCHGRRTILLISRQKLLYYSFDFWAILEIFMGGLEDLFRLDPEIPGDWFSLVRFPNPLYEVSSQLENLTGLAPPTHQIRIYSKSWLFFNLPLI